MAWSSAVGQSDTLPASVQNLSRRALAPLVACLLCRQEQLIRCDDLLCKLLASPNLPNVGQVLFFVVECCWLTSIGVLNALGGLGHLSLHVSERVCRR